MNQMNTYQKILCVSAFLSLFLFVQSTVAENQIVLNFYYSSSCHSCDAYKPIIREIEANYTGKVTVNWKDVGGTPNQANYTEWKSYNFSTYPSVVINNKILVPKDNLTREYLENILSQSLTENETNNTEIFFTIGLVATIVICVFVLVAYSYRKKKQE